MKNLRTLIKLNKQKLDDLLNQIKIIEEKKVKENQLLNEARKEDLYNQFTELKKIKITLNNRQKAEKIMKEKEAVKYLDEFNTIRFNKNKPNN